MKEIRIITLKSHLSSAIWNLKNAIDLYKEIKDKTEYWEKGNCINFDFKNWNKIKKVNGHICKYLKELLEVERSLNE